MITTEQIKELRDATGVSVMQCKRALEEANGDREKALMILRKKSSEISEKKADRTLKAGLIQSYLHSTGKVGVLIELLCETDFVAKNEEFKNLAYDIAMHIAALNPEYIKREDVSEETLAPVRELFKEEVAKIDKPEDIKEKMLQGKIDTYFKEKTLLDQPFIKNGDLTIKGLIDGAVQKIGEKIEVGRFVRYSLFEQ
ncbi:MAG: translation elongation factor Ts [Candidatus Paceibacterota bacterium]|jgi:elongation factor Ts